MKIVFRAYPRNTWARTALQYTIAVSVARTGYLLTEQAPILHFSEALSMAPRCKIQFGIGSSAICVIQCSMCARPIPSRDGGTYVS